MYFCLITHQLRTTDLKTHGRKTVQIIDECNNIHVIV